MAEARKLYYECHITMQGDRAFIEDKVMGTKWKFSAIDGDPILGEGVKCYATRHFNAEMTTKEVKNELNTTATSLELAGCNVIRRKVELVVYDYIH